MKTLLRDMTPIEWVGAGIIMVLTSTTIISLSYLFYAIVTGEADLSGASYGIAEGLE